MDEQDITTLLKAILDQWVMDASAADERIRTEAHSELKQAKRHPDRFFPLSLSAQILGCEPRTVYIILEQRICSTPIRQHQAQPTTRRKFGTPNRRRQEARAA